LSIVRRGLLRADQQPVSNQKRQRSRGDESDRQQRVGDQRFAVPLRGERAAVIFELVLLLVQAGPFLLQVAVYADDLFAGLGVDFDQPPAGFGHLLALPSHGLVLLGVPVQALTQDLFRLPITRAAALRQQSQEQDQ